MRILSRRSAQPDEQTVAVVAWGPDPTGARQVEALMAARGADLAGYGAHPGWGEPGSVEQTDQTIWASPQAFTGAGAHVALSAWAPGAVSPTQNPAFDATTQVLLPGAGGI